MFLLIVGLLILYALWDVNYFLRCIATFGYSMIFEKKAKIMDKTCIYGLCTSNDVDIFIRHMNNARYLRELDFARFHYYGRTGLYAEVKKSGGGAVQGASSIRYRRTIPIFTPYKIVTKVSGLFPLAVDNNYTNPDPIFQLIWWDDKAIYIEQQFISLGDNFCRAIAMSKQCLTKVNVMDLMGKFTGGETRPECPKELKLWLDSIEVCSDKLRKDK